MALRKALPAKLAATDADDTRYDLSGLIVCNSDGTPRGGVLSPVGVNLVTSTATMNVAVARFQGAAVRDAGVVLLANDGTTNVPLDAAPGANSRIDVVYAKQNDSSSTVSSPDGDDLPVFGVLKGVASASPVRNPAGLPAGALELAEVLIPSTATATNSVGVVITQTAKFTAGAGGVVTFRTKANMVAETGLPDGTLARLIGRSTLFESTAGVWAVATGEVFLANTAASSAVMGANSTMYILRGAGSAFAVFGVPTSHDVLGLAGNVYSNEDFEWNRSTGELKVKRNGTFEIEVRATMSNVSAGTVTLGITKNTTSIANTANDLARDDRANSASVTQSPLARIPAVALVTTDVIRFISFIFGAPAGVTVGGTAPYAANFRIRRIGD